jgi:glucosyl-3-phosphoglycerate phosphatase
VSTRRLLLLRHGRTQWNAQQRFQGHADPPLDVQGHAQAAAAAEVIAAMHPQVIVSSDALRASQTADPLAQATGLALRQDSRLRERGLGQWEGLTRDEVAQRFPDEYADWAAGHDVTRVGGESREEVAARVVAAVADLPDVPLAVLVMHGASANTLANALLGLDQHLRLLTSLGNCHWTELTGAGYDDDPVRWRVRAHNLSAPAGSREATSTNLYGLSTK